MHARAAIDFRTALVVGLAFTMLAGGLGGLLALLGVLLLRLRSRLAS